MLDPVRQEESRVTSAARAERRRAARAEHQRPRMLHGWAGWENGDDVAVLAGWCEDEPATVDDAKQQLHDQVIARLGDSRTGGVRWKIGEPGDGTLVEQLMAGNTDAGLSDHYRRILGLLREYGGRVIVAMAPHAGVCP